MRTLSLITLGTMRYGVWKDQVRSVREVSSIHRLPLSPACIAGIAVIDGRSTALADLAVCLGLRPERFSGSGSVLFVADREPDSGFLVSGVLEEVEVPEDAVFPMPEYLRTAELETCVVLRSLPVPVISLDALYDHIRDHDTDPSLPSLAPGDRAPAGASLSGEVLLFSAGNEVFGIPSAAAAGASVRPGPIGAAALTPGYVKGMVFHDGAVYPLVHLAGRLGLPDRGNALHMLTIGHDADRFGLLIDREQERLQTADVRPLPPVARTAWTPSAVLHQGVVVPVLDPGSVLLPAAGPDAAKDLPGRYAPASDFGEEFERSDVEVVEFSLLGVRHALPKQEVAAVLPMRPCRRVPEALPIVIGVAEHEGEVLPVLDLALVFGRRSRETQEWRMLLVRNGDFRALVITEAVYGERRLPREVQRKVPIVLPHELVYGCYPEGVVVRLILNVEALAVHFDKDLVKDLLPALTSEMAAAPAELVPSLLPDEQAGVLVHGSLQAAPDAAAPVQSESAPDAGQAGAAAPQERLEADDLARRASGEHDRVEAERAAEAAAAAERARREAEEAELRQRSEEEAERARQAAEEQARLEHEARERREAEAKERQEAEEETRRAAEERSRQEAERAQAEERRAAEAAEQARAAAEELEKRRAEEQLRLDREAQERREAEEKARQEAEEEARRAAAEAAERARREAAEQEQAEADAQRRQEEAEQVRRAAEERIRRETEEAERRDAEERAQRDQENEQKRAAAERARAAAGARQGTTPAAGAPEMPAAGTDRTARERNRYVIVGAALLLLLALLFFGLTRESGVPAPGVREASVRSAAERKDQGTAGKGTLEGPEPSGRRGKAQQEGPLVLTVPAGRSMETDVYIVKKGDTLWHICKRFTGDPFNYPRVARDNSIANPDLIFPGQEIRLRK